MFPLSPLGSRVPETLAADLVLFSPALVVFAAAIVVMLWEAMARPQDKRVLMGFTVAAMLVSLGLAVTMHTPAPTPGFGGLVRFDDWSIFFNVVFLTSGVLSVLLSHDYLERIGVRIGEYYSLALFGVFGMMLMGMGADLMLLFVALEVMSISFYVLSAIKRGDPRSVESGFKYFIMGSVASGILLYGVSFLYGATGSTSLEGIRAAVQAGAHGPLLAVGVTFVLVGFCFKVAAVPFHMWTPDVYEGAPSSVTAFMATGVKAASFAAFGRVLFVGFLGLKEDWSLALALVAGATMLVGNIAALVQPDLKRMLAYSSIAHAGYLMMALVAVDGAGVGGNAQVSGLLFYLLAYTFMNLGAFAVITLMAGDGQDHTRLSNLAGLAKRHPWLAAGLSLCLLSLAGIPPTMGFVGKFYLFAAAVRGDQVALAVVGALSGAIGVYYYLRPIVVMYMHDEEGEPMQLQASPAAAGALAVASLALLVFGLFPGQVLAMAREGVAALGG